MSHHDVQTTPLFAPLQGGCACGYIRYSLNAAPLFVHCCYCTSCQRETGTAFAVNALVEGDEVTLLPSAPSATLSQPLATFPSSVLDHWTPKQSRPGGITADTDEANGQTVETIGSPVLLAVPTDSGAPHNIARCPACLTAVWSNYGACPLLKFLRVGTLDSPALLRGPDVHIYVRSKPSYIQIPDDGKPRFDAFYPQKDDAWGSEVVVRRQKLFGRMMAWRKEVAASG
ncbi:glutathione-dependent aldehyde-activating protein [Colletotrichum truncatum]|uniref:Glutathione-dependent aldehyde-activating protein n=1 Tax=Colletotrichum truncatum TaxID=5467 RepID=A0ACC3YWZ5_COLTU|nr:glutathione-dependent aldehyde-activating protein [Colletotrichum truncatum]KAF6792604.1 glutathione-dependent aldehyde-activating protein [Colletotrichum truncatum]